MPKKLTQAEFLAKAVAVHGVGRYDYSQAVYVSARSKVKIICLEHGVFEQMAGNHIQGQGCLKCGRAIIEKSRKGTLEKFIARSSIVHGDKYDYSRVEYKSAKGNILIACLQHGIFEQQAGNHMQGQGCPKCAYESRNLPRVLGNDVFINRARTVHGARYDYSQVVYKDSSSKVLIVCSKHGLFQQRAYGHLSGKGCPLCSGPQSQSTITFIEKAHLAHGKHYDYLQAEYKNSATKVKIICPEHGIFEQLPGVHVKGHGCPSCARERTNEARRLDWVDRAQGRACLYFLRIFDDKEEFFKIGITYLSIERRYHKTGLNGYSYEVIAQHNNPDAARIYEWEQSILETFSHLRYQPKNSFGGESECFSSADEILAIFPL